MSDFLGNIITKSPATPTGPNPTGSAPGIWRMDEVAYWLKQGLWPDASADAYWPYTSLLLSTTSTNGAQNNTFLDSSTNNFTITRNGNTTQGSFSPYGSNWSNYFDGSGDYLGVASNAAFGMGTGDFTLECWVNPSAYTGTGNVLIDMRSGTEPSVRPDLEYNSSGTLVYRVNGSTVITGSTLPLNTWSHVALARSGTTTKLFLNGTQVGSSYTDSNNYGSSAACRIGADDDGSPNAYVNGFLSNVRVVKGTAVYTANFTPPATPLTAISGTSLLTCQSNRFIDNSSNAFTVTVTGDTKVQKFSPFVLAAVNAYSTTANGGSGYFDGSGDYLYTPTNAAFGVGTGDFTVEAWIFPTGAWTSGGFNCLLQIDGTGIYFGQNSGGFGLRQSGTANIISYGTSPTLNTWTHVAIVRSGTTVTMYYNGVSVATATSSANFSSGNAWVGSDATPGNYYAGFISNLRVNKGTAVYTSAFTPPTAPLTAISGTSLLLSMTNAGIYDATAINDMETVGNAQVSTTQAKFGTTSMYFDGNGDYLVTYNAYNLRMGSGNLTAECWIYPTSNTGWRGIFCKGNNVNQFEYSLGWEDGVLTARLADNGSFTVTDTVNLNAWNHIAYVRNGTNFTVYINGTAQGTTTSSTSFVSTQYSEPFLVGYYNFIGNLAYFQGYIDDVRITKGVARYTSNFTPPTQAFPVY